MVQAKFLTEQDRDREAALPLSFETISPGT